MQISLYISLCFFFELLNPLKISIEFPLNVNAHCKFTEFRIISQSDALWKCHKRIFSLILCQCMTSCKCATSCNNWNSIPGRIPPRTPRGKLLSQCIPRNRMKMGDRLSELGRCPTGDKLEKSRGKAGKAYSLVAVGLNEIFMEMAKAGANEECVCPQPNRDIHCSVHSPLFMGIALPHRCCHNNIASRNFIYEPKVPNGIMDTWQTASEPKQLANSCQYLNARGAEK